MITTQLTPKEHALTSLMGLRDLDRIFYIDEDRYVEVLAKRGLEGDEASSIVFDLINQGLIVRILPKEFSGKLPQYALTKAGIEAKEQIRDRQYQEIIEALGPVEERHAQLLRAADRDFHSKDAIAAWNTVNQALGMNWDYVETRNELHRVGLIQYTHSLTEDNPEMGGLRLTTWGMRLVREKGWSRYQKAANA